MQERTQGRTHPWQAAQGPPNDAHPGPTPADTCKYGIPLHGKKAFTDVMKDVGMGDYSGQSGWTQWNHRVPHSREAERSDSEKEEELAVVRSQARACGQLLKARKAKGTDFPPEPPRGPLPCQILAFSPGRPVVDFEPPEP